MLNWLAAFSLGLQVSMVASLAPDDIPGDLEKWIETDPPEPGSGRWFVANYDLEHQWVVDLANDRPRVRLRDRKVETPATLPFEIERGSAKDGLAGRRLSVKVSDGWIVGFNAGEFGAGLWWFSPDGKDRYKISEAWIGGFIPTEAGLLALEGLAHLSDSRGRMIRLTQPSGGRWRSEDFVDLKHTPQAYTKAADGSLIVATTKRLLRVVPASKKVEVLLDKAFWGGLYPNSMVVAPEGTAYLGMRHGVAKVEKKDGSWRVRWLLPNKGFDKAEPEPGLK